MEDLPIGSEITLKVVESETEECNGCVPERCRSGYTGKIDVRINPAKKDGTRSNREFLLWNMEVDSIKKIN